MAWLATHKKNKARIMLHSAKMRAKARGIPFSLTLEDIQIPDVCPVLGIPLDYSEGRISAGSPSLDKIDPSLGYIPGNIQVISHRANCMKHDASLEELRRFAHWILSKNGGYKDA